MKHNIVQNKKAKFEVSGAISDANENKFLTINNTQ
jgi:hypothetical protein